MNSELIFRISLGVLILALAVVRFRSIGWAVVGFPQAKSKPSPGQTGRIWYRLLLFVGWLWVIAPLIYVLAPRWLEWAALAMPMLTRWIGVGLGVSSIVFLAWVHQTLGKNWNVPGVVEERQVLVTDGPYRRMRHPMYTEFAVIALAYWLISTNWLIALIGLIYWMIVVTRVDREEAALTEKFGDAYREYMQRTGRYLPRFFRGA
jgi:protein-S-isoprenylcysteine O-methyltransferase Ste14